MAFDYLGVAHGDLVLPQVVAADRRSDPAPLLVVGFGSGGLLLAGGEEPPPGSPPPPKPEPLPPPVPRAHISPDALLGTDSARNPLEVQTEKS